MLVQLIFLAIVSGLVAIPLSLWTDLPGWSLFLISPPTALVGLWALFAVIDFLERPANRKWLEQHPAPPNRDEPTGTVDASIFTHAQHRACPECDCDDLARVLYGLPADPNALQLYIDAGRVVLGGCLVTDDDPIWHCNVCKNRFGKRSEQKNEIFTDGENR